MCALNVIEEFPKNNSSNQNRNLNIRVYEITSEVFDKNFSHLVNELYSRSVTFSIKITKEKTHLIIYSLDNLYRNESTRDTLLRHLQGSYSLNEVKQSEDIFIPPIRKVEQDGKLSVLNYQSGTNQYFLSCILSGVGTNSRSISRIFSNFAKDLVQADIFSIILTQFATRDEVSHRSNSWGIMFVARSDEKEDIIRKEREFQRYISASTEKLNCQLQFITKREIIRYKTNFRLLVPWIKHSGVLNDIIDLPKLLSSTMQTRRIVVPFPEPKEIKTTVPEEPLLIPKQRDLILTESEHMNHRLKPYPSVKPREMPNNIKSDFTTIESEDRPLPSNMEELSVPSPRTMNVVFDTEYLKVRLNKIFKELEFKETVIFEENFDLVLRKESYYIFVKFYKDILNHSHAYEIVEHLSSIAGLRNQFLCIVVADVMENAACQLLSEYNILHLTLTDVLVNDSLKAKLYGTVIA
ncbi:hypothetical protein EU534_00055 [Candidatus Heimdallarchaeota archaeon]|nr:MAG: hypothetical protein EU534_00055 [Candidatus Heimdallarchaeota archaeon]